MDSSPNSKVDSPASTTKTGTWINKLSDFTKAFVAATIVCSIYLAIFTGVLLNNPTDPTAIGMIIIYLLFIAIILFSMPMSALTNEKQGPSLGVLFAMIVFAAIGFVVLVALGQFALFV